MSALKLNHLALLVLFPAFLCGAAAGQQATESTHQVMTTAVYPNNSQGLVTLLNDALLAARNNDRICFLNDQREFGAPENTFHIRRTPDTRTCSDTAKGVPLWVESPEVASHLPATDQVRHCLDQQSLAPHIYQTTICSP